MGLNRPFAGLGGQTITVNLIEPGTLYGERVNQVDMRFAKMLRFGRTRSTVGLDVYNLTNSAAVLTYNQTFSPTTTHVAAAEQRPAGAVREDQRADRLLDTRCSGCDRPCCRPVVPACVAGGSQTARQPVRGFSPPT